MMTIGNTLEAARSRGSAGVLGASGTLLEPVA
jgi:hypothetical protein